MQSERILPSLLFLTLLLAAAAVSAEEPPQYPDPAIADMVAMSDGVRLGTDVYLPGGEGPWPVLLERTPYNRAAGGLKMFPLLNHGYAVVIQNLRGTRDSGGEWDVFGHDGWGGPGRQDGRDTVAWIRAQPWCDGKVGVAGFSASGIAAQLLLAAAPELVDCAFIGAASDNFYETAFPNGCWRENTIEVWPQARDMLPALAAHPTYDAFWRARNARARAYQIDVPVYIVAGWFDLFQRSATAFFRGVNNNGMPRSSGKCKLVMNTLAHAAPPGQLEFPNRGELEPDAAVGSILEWFAYWLKGADNGILEKPAVALFVMTDTDAGDGPGNRWRTFRNWPPPATPARFYLHAGGGLRRAPPGETDAATRYAYDPADPTPALGGNNLLPPSGPHDQREIEAREDVLVFETAPLDAPLTVVGAITLQLYASSSAVDTDFGARLCDVYPDGRSMLMNEGMLRASHRNGNTSPEAVLPGAVQEYTIDLWDTALIFAAGHRIRLAIVSASYPRYAPNPNTGAYFGPPVQPAVNTVHHNAQHASCLLLPIAEE